MERILVVGVELLKHQKTSAPGISNTGDTRSSIEELQSLCITAGGIPVECVIQKRKTIDPAYFIGYGKVEEIKRIVEEKRIDTVVFNDELTPVQQRNLENAINRKIVDRTRLILDIFAQRARTREGELQVELAQLLYLLPRLTKKGISLSQQVGGIGTRGPGETKLEVDRWRIRNRIALLRKNIEKIKQYREIQRMQRKEIPLPVVAIVGYTNAGKSTLLNRLTEKNDIYADDKLFATLDPTTRQVKLKDGRIVLFTDTVGFIQNLPTQLVAAFRATLEEITFADLILKVIDVSTPYWKQQASVVDNILNEMKIPRNKIICVFNKIDLLTAKHVEQITKYNCGIPISATKGYGIERLLSEVEKFFSENLIEKEYILPYNMSNILPHLKNTSIIVEKNFLPEGVKIKIKALPKITSQIEKLLDGNNSKYVNHT
jgi:GTP-binding protein HflX